MSYIVLARKYRPQKFDDIVGQEHITRVLKNALKENRIAHGYIFSGQRGVGKTTTARIFAKALNCKEGPKEEPCNKCDSCREILNGNSIDVMEIDAASNRGIDQIRELRENIKYAPSSSKYKIYIIDEAHQITNEAFNALLKTLEEPPAHAIFIFATTSTQKIPPTILSRCQRFSFRPLSIKEISEQIEKIAEKENIKIDDKAIVVIAKSVGGALRDALSVFDQVISFCGASITSQDVISILGCVKEDLLSDMFECIEKNDAKKLLQIIDKTMMLGYDPLNIATDLQEYLRCAMLYKISPELVITVSDTEKLKLYSQNLSIDVLFRLVQILSDCIEQMKNAEQPIMILEVFCVKLTQKYVGLDELIIRLENLESSSAPIVEIEPEKEEPKIVQVETKAVSSPPSCSVKEFTPVKIPIEKVRSAWNEISKDGKIRPRILACFSDAKISEIPNGGIFLIELGDSYKMETVLSNKNEWLPLMEKKLGGKFLFTAKVVPNSGTANNPEIEETEDEVPPSETIVSNEDDDTESSIAISVPPSKPSASPCGKNKKSDTMFSRNDATSAVKNIIDLFGGNVVDEK
ncbi:MAG: DNA polymerase III subunit gamma/tau [Elusimicrobia bacterium HGW-Elusimicrobia-4]|nr:MAG: DNA polymerase III subunit gamma/tau [Elusimicrobia bacterium HGW-Elusimicrobia-4]